MKQFKQTSFFVRSVIKLICLLAFFFSGWLTAHATHIAGGDITYAHVSGNTYQITLRVFKDNAPGSAGFSASYKAYIFRTSDNAPIDTLTFSTHTQLNNRLNYQHDACTTTPPPGTSTFEERIYNKEVDLPPTPGGYYIASQKLSNVNSVENFISQPAPVLVTYLYTTAIDNSPVFDNDYIYFVCTNRNYQLDLSASDTDGDSLVYSLDTTYVSRERAPFNPLALKNGYTYQQFFGINATTTLNQQTGILTVRPVLQGNFYFTIKVNAYRNDTLVSTVRRDLEIKASVSGCAPFIEAGPNQQICSSDSVALTASNIASGASPIQWTSVPNDPSLVCLNSPSCTQVKVKPTVTTIYYAEVTYNGTCTERDSVIITVDPTVQVDAGPDRAVCNGQPAQLQPTVTPPGSYTYDWSPGGNLSDSTALNPLVFASDTLVLQVNDGVCSGTDTVIVSTQELLVSCSGPYDICYGESVRLNFFHSLINTVPYVPYKIEWTPHDGLDDPYSESPLASPTSNKTYTITVTILETGCSASAQVDVNVNRKSTTFEKRYGQVYPDSTRANDGVCGTRLVEDCGYLIVGGTTVYDDSSGFYMVKTDDEGGLLWSKIYQRDHHNGNPLHFSFAHYVNGRYNYGFPFFSNKLANGYIVAGESGPDADYNTTDFHIYSVDLDGNLDTSLAFGGSGKDIGEYITQSNDGGYLAIGYTNSFGAGNDDAMAIKLSNNYAVEWIKVFGNAGYDRGYKIIETADGGYMIVGYTTSFGNTDILLTKLNSNASVAWSRIIGGNGTDIGESVWETPSLDGYYISGSTTSFGAGSYDAILLRVDLNGNVEWASAIGDSTYDVSFDMDITPDGPVTLTVNQDRWGPDPNPILVMIPEDGNSIQWQQSYGGTEYEVADNVSALHSVGIAAAATTKSFGATEGDLYLFATDGPNDSQCERPASLILTSIPLSSIRDSLVSIADSALEDVHIPHTLDEIPHYTEEIDICRDSICYCDPDDLEIIVESRDDGLFYQCCYDITIKPKAGSCPLYGIRVYRADHPYGAIDSIFPNPLLPGNQLTLQFCSYKFTGADRELVISSLGPSGELQCSTTRDISCQCSCDDMEDSEDFSIKLTATESDEEKCCYNVWVENNLTCQTTTNSVSITYADSTADNLSFTGNQWSLNSSTTSSGGTKTSKFMSNGAKLGPGKSVKVGTICFDGSDGTDSVTIGFNRGFFTTCESETFALSCDSNCCDQIEATVSTYPYSIPDQPANTCCYNINLSFNGNYTCDSVVNLNIRHPETQEVLWNSNGIQADSLGGLSDVACIPTYKLRSALFPLWFEQTATIDLEITDSEGNIICTKPATIDLTYCPPLEPISCCDSIEAVLSTSSQTGITTTPSIVSYHGYRCVRHLIIYDTRKEPLCGFWGVRVRDSDGDVYWNQQSANGPMQFDSTGTLMASFDLLNCNQVYGKATFNFTIEFLDSAGNPICVQPVTATCRCGGWHDDPYDHTTDKYYDRLGPNDFIPDTIVTNSPILSTNADELTDFFGMVSLIPNPAGDYTTINFQLTESATQVDIKVYNLNGQLLQQRPSGSMKEGPRAISFATDSLAPGTYFVRLEADGKSTVRKLVVIK